MKLKNIGYAALLTCATTAFVLGTAGSSEAAKKKKAAPAPQRSVSCLFTAPKAVCATRGGQSYTYRNACYAGNDGAVVKSQKACKPSKAMKGGKKAKKAMKKAGKKAMKKK